MMLPRLLFALTWAGASAHYWSSNTSSTLTLTVNTTLTHQRIDGFGFCEAFQRANSLYNAPPTIQKEVLDLLFDTSVGAGLSILRLGLGSSPNSTKDHMNSIEPAPPLRGKDPVYAWDRNASNQVWLAQRARDDYGVGTFYADAWSAPGFMKTNGRDDEGGFLLQHQVDAYVAYLMAYVTAWTETEGIPLKHIGIVNEPNVVKEYATMGLANTTTNASVASAVDIIRPLHANLVAHANNTAVASLVGISCCEAQGWSMQRDLLPSIQATIDDGFLSVITTHAYKGSPGAPDAPLNTTLPVWITENSPIMQRLGFSETWHANSSENEGLVWANNLHTALVIGNVSAYLYWIGAGQFGEEVPFVWLDRREGGGYRIAATYWATAHWSRFVRPGAKRVDVSERSEDIKTSAFVNPDGSVAVQAINNSDGNVTVALYAPEAKPRQARTVTRWLTDNGHHLENMSIDAPERDQNLEAILPPRSLTTLHIQYRWKKDV